MKQKVNLIITRIQCGAVVRKFATLSASALALLKSAADATTATASSERVALLNEWGAAVFFQWHRREAPEND